MYITYYKRTEVDGVTGYKTLNADIDLSKIKQFNLVNKVIRRKDGYIRRFVKVLQIGFQLPYMIGDMSFLTPLDTSYLKTLKEYAKEVGGFKLTKEPVIEKKLMKFGLVDRKAINWYWER